MELLYHQLADPAGGAGACGGRVMVGAPGAGSGPIDAGVCGGGLTEIEVGGSGAIGAFIGSCVMLGGVPI